MAKKSAAVAVAANEEVVNEVFTPAMLDKPTRAKRKTAAPAVVVKPTLKAGRKAGKAAIEAPVVVPIKAGKKRAPAAVVAEPVKTKGKATAKPAEKVVPITAAKRGRKFKELSFGIEDIKGYVEAGWTLGQIAPEFGISVPTLYNRFPEIKGLSPKGRRYYAEA